MPEMKATVQQLAKGIKLQVGAPHLIRVTAAGQYPIEVLLTDHDDKPLPNKPYRLTFPNGDVHEGVSDADGNIHHPDNDHEGDAHLALTDYS